MQQLEDEVLVMRQSAFSQIRPHEYSSIEKFSINASAENHQQSLHAFGPTNCP
jgi:hypothetical protein